MPMTLSEACDLINAANSSVRHHFWSVVKVREYIDADVIIVSVQARMMFKVGDDVRSVLSDKHIPREQVAMTRSPRAMISMVAENVRSAEKEIKQMVEDEYGVILPLSIPLADPLSTGSTV